MFSGKSLKLALIMALILIGALVGQAYAADTVKIVSWPTCLRLRARVRLPRPRWPLMKSTPLAALTANRSN